MHIIEDSRQQAGKHKTKHEKWAEHGVNLYRCALPYGDYAKPPRVSVDTKASMLEIAQNIGGSKKEHARFRNELIRAKDCGAHLYVLVENEEGIKNLQDVATWTNPRLIDYPDAITGDRLAKAMATMQERYGVTFLFCHPQQAAGIIYALLERDV